MGPVALSLERLLNRDGHSFEEACQVMRCKARGTVSVGELSAIRMRLPARARRRFLTDVALDDVAIETPAPDLALFRAHAVRTLTVLRRSFTRLSKDDRTLMRLRFADCRSVAEIARRRGIDQKKLYRTFEGLLAKLRTELEHENINAGDVRSWLGQLELASSPSRECGTSSSANLC